MRPSKPVVRPSQPGPRPGGAWNNGGGHRPPVRPNLGAKPDRTPSVSPDGHRPPEAHHGGLSGSRFGRPSPRPGFDPGHGPGGGGLDHHPHGGFYGSPSHPNWHYADRHGIHYGGRPYHCDFVPGHHYHHSGWGFGLWISFRGVPWYYCPTYRSDTYVYVSTVYESHYYFGAGTGSGADHAVALVDTGWRELERGQYDRARRTFAEASAQSPDWGLPKIGYALSLAGAGHDRAAGAVLRLAMSEDPYAALEVPWSDELGYLLDAMDARYTSFAEDGVDPENTWFMAASMRLMLGDTDGAAEAAFAAETAGAPTDAINGLYDVLTATEDAPTDDGAPVDDGYDSGYEW
ncbi:MAG: hypothetical protein R3B57_12365 [Phycisphaerales bacterium]